MCSRSNRQTSDGSLNFYPKPRKFQCVGRRALFLPASIAALTGRRSRCMHNGGASMIIRRCVRILPRFRFFRKRSRSPSLNPASTKSCEPSHPPASRIEATTILSALAADNGRSDKDANAPLFENLSSLWNVDEFGLLLTSLQDRNLNAVEIRWPFRLGLKG